MARIGRWLLWGFVGFFVLTVLVIIVALVAGGGDDPQASPSHEPAVREATPTPKSLTITVGTKSQIERTVEEYAGVRDALVTQDGDDVSLVLVVDYALNEARARQLGDNFVRLTKSLGPDDSPGGSIGTGKLNYLVGVYYPNENRVALGAKAKHASSISW